MKFKKLSLLIMTLVFSTLFTISCTNKNVNQKSNEVTSQKHVEVSEVEKDSIKVATPGTYQLFTAKNDKGELEGLDIEIWKEIGKRVGRQIEFIEEDIDAAFGDIDTGRVDTAAKQISITAARKEKYLFSEPYFYSPYKLMVAENNTTINSLEDMHGKKMGIRIGSAANGYIQDLDPDGKIEIIPYNSNTIPDDIDLGRIDAMPYSQIVLPGLMEKTGKDFKLVGDLLYEEENAFPFAMTERGTMLKTEVDEAIIEMKNDGTLSEFCLKWTNIDPFENK